MGKTKQLNKIRLLLSNYLNNKYSKREFRNKIEKILLNIDNKVKYKPILDFEDLVQ